MFGFSPLKRVALAAASLAFAAHAMAADLTWTPTTRAKPR